MHHWATVVPILNPKTALSLLSSLSLLWHRGSFPASSGALFLHGVGHVQSIGCQTAKRRAGIFSAMPAIYSLPPRPRSQRCADREIFESASVLDSDQGSAVGLRPH